MFIIPVSKNIARTKPLTYEALREFYLYVLALYHDVEFRFIYGFSNLVKK